MRYYFLFVVLFLSACSTKDASEVIAGNVHKDLDNIKESIAKVEDSIDSKCKTEVVISNLENVRHQISSVGGQIQSITTACDTEKAVLEGEINNLRLIALTLIILLAGIIYLFVRRK